MVLSGRGAVCTVTCALFLFSFAACGGGGSAPTQPSAPAAPPAWTFKGSVTETLTGRAVEGATLSFNLPGGATATSGAGGAWELPGTGVTGNIEATVSAPGYLTRQVHLQNPILQRHIGIDLIKEAAPFSLTFYRQLVRDAFDEPDNLQPLRRWTTNPNFYIRTHNPRTEQPILASELEMLIATIRAAVPQLTGGQFAAGEIETGIEERSERPGQININFVHDPAADYCGQATVGGNPGRVTLNHGIPGCQSACGAFAPRTVAHEIGHAMGFYHVEQGAVLNTVWYNRDCGVTDFSEAESYHARVAYARPRGNTDTDADPPAALLLQAPAAPPVILSCR